MTFELLVCGSAGTHPGPGRACSGYLFRTEDTTLLADCGNGSTATLQHHVALTDLDAIVLSHRHHDHWADLVGLYYALRFQPDGARSIDVYAPQGTAAFIKQLLSDDAAATFDEVCRFHDVGPGDRLSIGDIELSFHDSPHAVPTVAMRLEHHDGVAAYSGDSGGGPGVVAAARGADLFLCEASWTGSADERPEGLHLTAGGAGELARAAGARRLVLTHLWPSNDRESALREARDAFPDGHVELAEDGAVLVVGS